MLLEYKPGMSLSDPWAFTLATRGNPGFQTAKDLTLKGVGATVVRDAHYINGIRTTLFECGSTNWCLQSQALATTWGQGVQTATNNAGVAPDGTTTATSLIPTAVSSAVHQTTQAITVTANEFVAFSGFLKASGYAGVQFHIAGNLGSYLMVSVNLTAGTLTTTGLGSSALTGSVIVPLANGWYWVGVWGKFADASTSATFTVRVFDTPAHANSTTAYTGDAVSGILAWGMQLERWGTLFAGAPTSYVATTTIPVARTPDTITTPWPFQTMPMWFYMKFIDLGWSQRANFEEGPKWSDSGAVNRPALRIFTGAGAIGSTPNHRFNWNSNTGPSAGSNQISAQTTPGVAYGDTVELFGRFFKDASLELNRSINGAAPTQATGAAAGGAPFVDFVTPTLFYLNNAATLGLQVLRVGADPARITTLALAAAA